MSDHLVKFDAQSVEGCKLPPPSLALFEAMARAALEAGNESGVLLDHGGKSVEATWEDASENFKEALLIQARVLYAVIAQAAGAKPRDPDATPPMGKARRLRGGTD